MANRIVRLTEKQLNKIIGEVLNEQDYSKEKDSSQKEMRKNFSQMEELKMYMNCIVQKHHRNTLRINCPKDNIFFETEIS